MTAVGAPALRQNSAVNLGRFRPLLLTANLGPAMTSAAGGTLIPALLAGQDPHHKDTAYAVMTTIGVPPDCNPALGPRVTASTADRGGKPHRRIGHVGLRQLHGQRKTGAPMKGL